MVGSLRTVLAVKSTVVTGSVLIVETYTVKAKTLQNIVYQSFARLVVTHLVGETEKQVGKYQTTQ